VTAPALVRTHTLHATADRSQSLTNTSFTSHPEMKPEINYIEWFQPKIVTFDISQITNSKGQ